MTLQNKLTNSASILFSARLYVDVSIMDIVNKAGVSRGSFYNHFNTKDECFVSSMVLLMQKISQNLRSFSQNSPLIDVLNFHLDSIHRNIIIYRNASSFMYVTENESLREVLHISYSTLGEEFRNIIYRLVKNTMPQTDEDLCRYNTKLIALYFEGITSELCFKSTLRQNSTCELSVTPEDFLVAINLVG